MSTGNKETINPDTRIRSKQALFACLQEVRDKLQKLGVKKLGVFGSFQRSAQSSDSDIDILVTFKEGEKTFDNYITLHDLLSDVTGREVELVSADGLSTHIGPHILKSVEYVPLSD